MKRFLALLMCAVMLLGVTACKKKNQTPPATNPSGNTTTTTTTETSEDVLAQYALDPLVDRFLTDMVTAGAIDSQSIHRSAGTAGMTEEELLKSYEATLNGLPITVRNVSYEAMDGDTPYTVYRLMVSIEGGCDERSKEALLTAFSSVVAALGCNKSNADSVKVTLESATEIVQELRIDSNVYVMHYAPIINNPEMAVSIPCRIDLIASDYRAANA